MSALPPSVLTSYVNAPLLGRAQHHRGDRGGEGSDVDGGRRRLRQEDGAAEEVQRGRQLFVYFQLIVYSLLYLQVQRGRLVIRKMNEEEQACKLLHCIA